MKKIFLFVTITFLINLLYAQKGKPNEYSSIDKKALQLPDSLTTSTADIANYISSNFKTDTEKARAIFIWIATNIHYDIDNMFAINFYEENEEKINKPLRSRKGICENYAMLFTDICNKIGIKSYAIEGYTKQNGFTDYIPHAWSAALIDSAWFIFDPTWGSGYVQNGKFYNKINNSFFKANPEEIIKSHMPFDYLWQFLNYPVTNQEFYEGKTQINKSKPYFHFQDSIINYENLEELDQLITSAERIERNGLKNSLIFDRYQRKKLAIENIRQTEIVNLYNSAVADYNNGINDYNNFIHYRNKQFTPSKPDAEIQEMIDVADVNLNKGKFKLNKIKNPDASAANMIAQLDKSIYDALLLVKEQQDWLKEYLSKSKSKRKAMFYERRATLFGIPVN